MALAPRTYGVVTTGAANVAVPTTAHGVWLTIHNDITATAATAAQLLRPLSVTSSNVRIVRVPSGAVRVRIRARYTAAVNVTTAAIVRVYGLTPPLEPSSEFTATVTDTSTTFSFADDGTTGIDRVDADTANAAGVTLSPIASPLGANIRDGTYSYSDVFPYRSTPSMGYDLAGASYMMALVEQAAVLGSGAAVLQAMFIN